MIARFAGRCQCGERFAAGAEVTYDRESKKITGCPSCGGAEPSAPSASPPATPTAPTAPAPRAMAAKFGGKCRCGARFAKGTSILYAKATGGVVGCPSCAGGEAAAPVAAPRDEIVPFVGTPLGAEPVPASAIPARTIPLDDHQLAVVAFQRGTALVAAGAGAGKSTTLIERQAALAEAGTIPEQIVTLVFNRSAATDFRAKNARRFGGQLGSRFQIQTFHAFAFALLRMWFPTVRRFAPDRIIGLDDGPNGYRLATAAMKTVGIETGEPGDYMAASGMIREALIDLDAADAADRIAEMEIAAGSLRVAEELAKFSREYQKAKVEAEAIDFSDMLALVCDEIRQGTEHARALTTIYRHVQVDECFPARTPILLADGTSQSIGEIVEAPGPLPKVLSFDWAIGKTVARQIIGVKKTLLQKRTVRIVARQVGYGSDGQRLAPLTEKTQFGLRFLVCTEDHRLFTSTGQETPAGKLKAGDRLQLEDSAPQVQAFNHRYKIGLAGKEALRESLSKRQAKMPQGTGGVIKRRGGNGNGLTVPQQVLLAALGSAWRAEYVLPTGTKGAGTPSHYKIDLAHPGCKIAIEVDGKSHGALSRKEADARKDAFLASRGWEVHRVSNLEAIRDAKAIAQRMPKNCPVEAEVISVEEYPIEDYYVYDLSIEGTHCYYANGLLAHNCQDINPARLCIAKHLGSGAQSLVAVGDTRQAIYGFTGSRPDLFRGLLDDGAQLLTLPVNRRSTQAIVEAGNKIAAGRDWNLGGACSAAPTALAGEPVRIWNTADPVSEAQQVAAEIQRSIAAGLPIADEKGNANYACLARTNAAGAALESSLLATGLPVRVLGAHGGVWSTSVGRDVLAYLRAAEGVAHEDLTRIANKPLRYAKRAAITDAVAWAKREGLKVSEPLARCGDRGAFRLSSDLSRLARLTWPERCQEIAEILVGDLHERAAEAAANGAAARAAKPDEDREAAVKALCAAAETASSLQAIEDQIRKMKDQEKDGEKKPAVEIATIHKSKGLEWSHVFVCGAAAGQLPHANATDIEEERRLFYVAVTRAKHLAVISIGSSEPSPFLADLGWHPEPEPEPEPKIETEKAMESILPALGADATGPTTPPAPSLLAELARAIESARSGAQAATDIEPRSSGSGIGSRFVEIERGDFEALLRPLGFEGTDEGSQVIYVNSRFPPLVFRIYSSIPVGTATARDLGKDSIKVTVTRQENGCERPLHKRLPYAARTRSWRLAVLDRLAELVELARGKTESQGAASRAVV